MHSLFRLIIVASSQRTHRRGEGAQPADGLVDDLPIQELISQSCVEALDVAIPSGAAQRHVVRLEWRPSVPMRRCGSPVLSPCPIKGFKPQGEVGVHAVDGPVRHAFPVLLIRQRLRSHFHRAIAYARFMVDMGLAADRADEGMVPLWANIQRPWTKGWGPYHRPPDSDAASAYIS